MEKFTRLQVFGKSWLSLGKYRKVQNFFCSHRKGVKNIDKDSDESALTISYKINFIDSARFMASS